MYVLNKTGSHNWCALPKAVKVLSETDGKPGLIPSREIKDDVFLSCLQHSLRLTEFEKVENKPYWVNMKRKSKL